jgi:tetratricopeptide (TPR) repeat protein
MAIAISLFCTVKSSAQNAAFDSSVTRGIHQIYSLDFQNAEGTFRKLISDYPGSPAGRFFLATIDWWKILIDLDNEEYDDLFFQKLEDVIFQCDKILENEPDNVNALFFKGGAIGFRGRLRAIRESWLKAADDGREALPIVQRAAKLEPNNKDVELGFGLYNYYAAVIPEEFPLVKPLMIFFPSGDKAQGINQLNDVAYNGKYSKFEAQYFLMTLYSSNENNPYKADEYAQMLLKEFPNNSVFLRWKARIAVQRGATMDYFTRYKDIYARSERKEFGYNEKTRRESLYYLGLYYKTISRADSALICFQQCAALSKIVDKKEETGFLVNATLFAGMMSDALGKREDAVSLYNQVLDLKKFGTSRESAKLYLQNPYKLF